MNGPPRPSQLADAGAFLEGGPGLSFEWSLRLDRSGAAVRERVICWLRAERGEQGAYDGLAHLLEAQGCPPAVRAHQARLAATSLSQGAGLSVSHASGERSLYIHHADPATGEARYDAWRWSGEGEVEEFSYRSHFLPCTSEGSTPERFVHPDLAAACARYAGNDRVRRMSGFWLRHRKGQVDQTSLTYPWLPQLAEVEAGLLDLFPALSTDPVYRQYREHHFRHLAFNSGADAEASMTVYFSAPWRAVWPASGDAVRDTVRSTAAPLGRQIAQRFLAPLAPAPVPAAAAPDPFGVQGGGQPWPLLFGPGLHAHNGFFSSDPPEHGSDEPFTAALDELRQLIAHGSSVYDAGSGWGAQGALLARSHACRVVGTTASAAQHRHCAQRGLPSRHGDIADLLPPGAVDCVLMLESLESVRDKAALLRALRLFAPRLVLRTSCRDAGAGPALPGAPYPVSSAALRALLAEAGWRVRHWQDRRALALPSIGVWHARLALLPASANPRLLQWRSFCGQVAGDAQAWGARHPLLDIVAD